MPKLKNSNATFWVIFKHCGRYQASFMLKSAVKDDSQNSCEMNDYIMNPERDPQKICEIEKG
mgnify:CR=1 FL=1